MFNIHFNPLLNIFNPQFQLQRALLVIVARHKANQQEHNEFIFGKLQDLCTQFMHDPAATAASLGDDIAQLRAVVEACSPRALYTAEDLSAALVSAMVESVAGHRAVEKAASTVMLKDPSKRYDLLQF